MNASEINTASNLHKIFLIELKAHVLGIQNIDEVQIKNENSCYLTKLFANTTDYNEDLKKINTLHNEIHFDATTIYSICKSGSIKNAKEEFKQFEKKSKILLTLLENYKATLTTNNSLTE